MKVLACLLLISTFIFGKNVLILNSYSPTSVWTQEQSSAIIDTLKTDKSINIFVEFMDTKTFKPNNEMQNNLLNYYSNKYKDIALDVVITTDDNAINFILRNQNQKIFKNAKFFFSGVNNLALAKTLDKNMFTGLFEEKNPIANLNLARKIKKNLKTVYLIGDNTITSHKIIEDYKQKYATQKDINFIYLDYTDIDKVIKKLDHYEKNSILMLMVFAAFQKNKKRINNMLALEYITNKYKNPMITHDSIYTNLPKTNIIGGDCVDSKTSGEIVARDVIRYFNGTKIKNIKFKYTEGNNLYINEKNLNRFGLKIDDLNLDNPIIVNKNNSFYIIHEAWINGLIFLFIAIIVFIFIFFKIQQNRALNLSNKRIQDLNNSLESRVSKQVEEIKKTTMLFEKIFNTVKNGIAIIDLNSNFLLINSAYKKITGFSKEEFFQTSSIKLTTTRSREKSLKILNIVQEKGFFYGYEKQHIVKSGGTIDVLMDFALMPDKKSILIVVKDITVEKRLRKEKKIREEQLLQQVRLAQMGEMISMIAHQWRQPLGAIGSAIIGMKLQLKNKKNDLSKDKISNDYIQYADRRFDEIGEYVHFLSATIDDFRDFFKPDKEKESTDITIPIEKALQITLASIKNKNIKLTTDYHINDSVLIYKNELIQVLLNILKNAEDNFVHNKIKNCEIKITTKKENDNCIISVYDNGGGIKSEILPFIFDPYFSTKSRKNGTGLGLYMSKLIIEEHNNGKISVQNIDDGTEFKISFKSLA
ncbi:MAG: PAS domain S-box protein [Epsilonproteobacteria bacterium]|nr:PAS domain S-box protein [Campylobacterota bacterium]